MTTGSFPENFKIALIKPHLKKQTLDPDLLKNYRPVSNLHFLSKIVEKVVIQRLEVHITSIDLQDYVQSAYRKQHSTETALLKIHNDIVTRLDQKKCTLLATLNLSAAFDTVDHSIVMYRLHYEYVIGGVALQWFRLYQIEIKLSRYKAENQTFIIYNVGFHKDLYLELECILCTQDSYRT